tara:strand:- start:2612 stop:3028 length:417 start_codon:yes stop_codon:yes gene_type:complete
MALTVTTLKLNDTEAVVKVSGANDAATIDISTLLPATQALDGATQTVNISAIQWAGDTASIMTIARNSVNVMVVDCTGSDEMLFAAGYSESSNNTSDIVVTVTGNVAAYFTLRKISGYANKIETAQFSIYDDETAVGS